MKLNDILNSEDYKKFLIRNLTISQHESILLKYLIKINVEEMKCSGYSKEMIFKLLAEDGFEIDKKKIFINSKTIHKYYYTLK